MTEPIDPNPLFSTASIEAQEEARREHEAQPSVLVTEESWAEIHTLVHDLAGMVASMLVSSNMVEKGQVLEISTMRELVDEHAEIASVVANHDTKDELTNLYGAIISIDVGGKSIVFLDRRLQRAVARARIAIG